MNPADQSTSAPRTLPSAQKLRLYLALNLLLYLLFAVVYGATNYLASKRDFHFHFFAEWERAIPFVPAMIYIYFSIGILFWLPLFFVETARIKRLGFFYAACIIGAGICFLLFPATTAFGTGGAAGDPVFELLYRLDYPHNTVPSLHIALSTLTVLAVRGSCAQPVVRVLLLIWLGAIMLSVLLVHQHHLMDVAGGWLLGYLCYLGYRRPA